MKNKGTIIFFSIALAVVSVYHLSFTWVVNNVESKAKEMYTTNDVVDSEAYKHHLDSLESVEIYNLGVASYTYSECKQQELNLGLDLQGGMNVILEVSKADIINALAGINENDKDFQAALVRAKELAKEEDGEFEDLFAKAFGEVAPDRALAPLFANKDNQEYIGYETPNDEVVAYLKKEASSSVERVYEVIETRIGQSNVSQPTLQRLDNGRISAELPGVDNPTQIRQLLEASAKLEFWEVMGNTPKNEFAAYKMLESMNKALADKIALADTSNKDDAEEKVEEEGLLGAGTTAEEAVEEVSEENALTSTEDTTDKEESLGGLLGSDSTTQDSANQKSPEELRKENPLYTVLFPYVDQQNNIAESSIIAIADKKDKKKVMEYVNDPIVRKGVPSNVTFAWSAKPLFEGEGRVTYGLYALKGKRSGEPQLAGDMIVDARPSTSQTGQIEVVMKMNDFGAKEWASLTKKNVGEFVAIVLDGRVYSAPVVNGEIPNGISTISGDFDIKEANFLSNVLKAGKLPAPATIVAEDVVGPTLGDENIRQGMLALLVGFLSVILFMIAYYNKGGFIADLAVLANVFLILGVLSAYGAALTLPGIAGIVLTIGMAVDANVLIFERIKEELSHGKTIKSAVSNGYKQALWSIIDANVTTLIAGIILATTGSGPVYGFAVILIIGILTSLFTSLLLSRLIIESRLAKGKDMTFSFDWSRNVLRNTNIDFIKNRKKFYIVSGLIIIAGIAAMFSKGISRGIDFKGGWSYQIQMDEDQTITSSDIKTLLDKELENSSNEVKTIGTNNQFKIVTTYMLDNDAKGIADKVQSKVLSTLSKYGVETKDILQSAKVGPTIAQNTRSKSTNRMIIALILMFAYIVIRFKKWGFGLGATIALFHDVLIVFSLFAIFGGILPFALEVDQAFIAAILTVIGYSINDSVVVFDRVREYLRENKSNKDTPSLINTAINDTLSRTVVTSLTTILVILILFVFGGMALKGFTFALLIGVIVGTYSSACIATPIVVDVEKLRKKKEDKNV